MKQDVETFIVVGATSGIGLEIVSGLLKAKKRVVMVVRNPILAQEKIKEFYTSFPNAQIEYLVADLSNQHQVEAVAQDLLKICPKIKCLINNAGVFMTSHQLSDDNIEHTFAVNHMSHFILTLLLLDRLIQSGSSRIIMLGSNAHKFVKDIQFENIGWKDKFRSLKVYGQSKLANILFTRYLAKQLPKSVSINAADPGAVATRIGCNNGKLACFVSALCRPFYRSIPKGAETPLYLALSPEVEGKSGFLFKNNKIIEVSKTAKSEDLGQKLWDFSMDLWRNGADSL